MLKSVFLLMILFLLVGCSAGEKPIKEKGKEQIKKEVSTLMENEMPKSAGKVDRKNEIRYLRNSTGNYIETIQFWDEKTNQLISSFDIKENDPYRSLEHPILRNTEDGGVEYQIDSKGIADEDRLFFITAKKLKEAPSNLDISKAKSTISVYTGGKNSTVIAYNLMSFNTNNELVGYKGSASLLDNNGEVIETFNHLDLNIRLPIISEDGTYFAFLSGGVMRSDGWSIAKEKFNLFSVKDKKVLIELEASENEKFTTPVVLNESKIFFESDIGYSSSVSYKYWVIDVRKRVLYTKVYDKKTRNNLINIDGDGLEFKEKTGNRVDLFDVDFTKQKI